MDDFTIFALVSDQGTACAETALCVDHVTDEDARRQAWLAADTDANFFRGFIDCTGNDALACTVCGASF